jgi:hypothetical protein
MPQISGSVLLDTIKAVKTRQGDQEFAKILAHLHGEAKLIFNAPIESWRWYPVDAFVSFLETDIRETADGDRRVLIERSKKVIESQLHGIYKFLVRIGSPKFVINRIATIHASYFQGVQIIPEIEDGPRATIKYIGFEKHHDIMEYIVCIPSKEHRQLCLRMFVLHCFTVELTENTSDINFVRIDSEGPLRGKLTRLPRGRLKRTGGFASMHGHRC